MMTRTITARRSQHSIVLEHGRFVIMAIAIAMTMASCSKDPVEACLDESISHLQMAVEMLRANQPSIEKLSIAVVSYRSQNKADFRRLRLEGERLFSTLSDARRKTLADKTDRRAKKLLKDVEASAALYPDKRIAMRLVRPLMVYGTPKGLRFKGGNPPWLPKGPKSQDPKGHDHHDHHDHEKLPPGKLLKPSGLPHASTPGSYP